jgi:hypothetical protein
MDPVVKVTCNYVKKISRRMNKTEKTPEFFFFFNEQETTDGYMGSLFKFSCSRR